ncbi:acylphosphatase [Singulisphaera sp. PoT]|uniref:acylphosphatase n=1 Tax=Singulisphaera sp. PoT TaxID=3411797 RepID=UPI003BF49AE2
MSKERRRVYYSGRVQGVGFRYTSERLSQGFDVAGYVRNMSDGRVELVVDGPPDALKSFLDAIRGELGDKIHDVSVEQEPVGDPPYEGFSIRY